MTSRFPYLEVADGGYHQLLPLQRQRSRRNTQAHPDQSLAQFLPLVVAREERDTAYGELITDVLEHICFGAQESDGLSPDRPVGQEPDEWSKSISSTLP